VEISVHHQGGILGENLVVKFQDGTLRIESDGVVRGPSSIDSAIRARIQSLASRLMNSQPKIVRYEGPPISDDTETSIDIRDGAKHTTVKVASGDEAPQEVWELIGTALEATQGLR
jgi:hypothetical protein